MLPPCESYMQRPAPQPEPNERDTDMLWIYKTCPPWLSATALAILFTLLLITEC